MRRDQQAVGRRARRIAMLLLALALSSAPRPVVQAQSSHTTSWVMTARVPAIARVGDVGALSPVSSDSGFALFTGTVDLAGNTGMTLQVRLEGVDTGVTLVQSASGWKRLTTAWVEIAVVPHGAPTVPVAYRRPAGSPAEAPTVAYRVVTGGSATP